MMMGNFFPAFFVLILLLLAAVFIFNYASQARRRRESVRSGQNELLDARADANRWIDRLSSEILLANPTDERAKQLVGQASQRHATALSQAGAAQTVAQARIARDVAVEGLYYMRDARRHMGEVEGPPLPELGS